MWIGVITLLPELFENFSNYGVTRRAFAGTADADSQQGELDCHFFNPRDHSVRKHGQIDDKPYGGGPGMVMQVEPVEAAVEAALHQSPLGGATTLVVPTPQGVPVTQRLIRELASLSALVFLCGRYEGIDERVLTGADNVLEVSLGDYVLTGGELPTQVILDAMSRWLPGTLGNVDSAPSDSFADGLLEGPSYTRPEVLADGRSVPEVLLSGDHQAIARYRRKRALERTLERRPELLLQTPLDELDRALLRELSVELSSKIGLPAGQAAPNMGSKDPID